MRQNVKMVHFIYLYSYTISAAPERVTQTRRCVFCACQDQQRRHVLSQKWVWPQCLSGLIKEMWLQCFSLSEADVASGLS